MSTAEAEVVAGIGNDEKYGFHDPENYVFKSRRGLSREIVEEISAHKSEPAWMRESRPKSREHFLAPPLPAPCESEGVYRQRKEGLERQGVAFPDMASALREHEDVVRQHFGTIIPPNDNKFAALNTAVWSGGSFIYVPPGVKA